MSSDSEDDCYGNIAQKLQSMKSKYREDKIETTNLLLADLKEKTDNSWRKNDTITQEKDCDVSQADSQNSEIGEEYSLDAIIAKNSKKRVTRSTKRNADVCTDNILPEKATRSKRAKKNAANTSQCATTTLNDAQTSQSVVNTLDTSQNSQTDAPTVSNSVTETTRGRGRGRGRQTPRQRGRGRRANAELNNSRSRFNRSRGGRNGYRSRSQWSDDMNNPSLYDLMAAIAASTAMSHSSTGPIYSVGNTDEYPDQSDDQPLFNSSTQNDVVVVDNEEFDENEELSVKVYWQSSEHVKFNIRRFQKLTQIFDHFAEREKVGHDKLFFTYNERILKRDDTPDSIGYSIVKFIDGGIINQSVSSIVKNDKHDGIKLKFQCQNVKKPFMLSLSPDDKMSVVMMKCAEHLEKPLDKLKLYFDGDLISGKLTAREMELEGGECIDVKIVS